MVAGECRRHAAAEVSAASPYDRFRRGTDVSFRTAGGQGRPLSVRDTAMPARETCARAQTSSHRRARAVVARSAPCRAWCHDPGLRSPELAGLLLASATAREQ